jgi:hypothetical protein
MSLRRFEKESIKMLYTRVLFPACMRHTIMARKIIPRHIHTDSITNRLTF